MAFLYPWGNTQQLNLDWILQKIKELEAGGGGGSASLDDVANALISASYAVQAYDRSDIVFRDGKLYRANQAIPAPGEAWTPAHWDEILLGDTVSNLVQYVAALSNDQIANSSNVSGVHTSDALNTLKTATEAAVTNVKYDAGYLKKTVNSVDSNIIQIEDTPSNDSGKLPSSKAVYDANADIADLQSEISAHVETTLTASRAYIVGEYLVYNGRLYRVEVDIANGAAITIGTNVVAVYIDTELQRAQNFPIYQSGGGLVEITDSTFGFIDTGISTNDYLLLAVHMWLESNIAVRISNLMNGNYRIQLITATSGALITSGSHRPYYVYMRRSDLTSRSI